MPGGAAGQPRAGVLAPRRLRLVSPGVPWAQDRAANVFGDEMTVMVKRTLPNGLVVSEINKYETQFLYKEIFTEASYLRNGIEIQSGDLVFDVGANIGLFALFCLGQADDVSVVAYEPAPNCLACLRENLADHPTRCRIRDVAASDAGGELEFTYYPNYSIMSGTMADTAQDLEILKKGAIHQLGPQASPEVAERMAEMLVRDKMSDPVKFMCHAGTLSDEIDRLGVEQFGLLKVDIEKAEGRALAGIADRHWTLIRQVVVEAHDLGMGEHQGIIDVLKAKGFDVVVDSSADLSESDIYNVYARRPG